MLIRRGHRRARCNITISHCLSIQNLTRYILALVSALSLLIFSTFYFISNPPSTYNYDNLNVDHITSFKSKAIKDQTLYPANIQEFQKRYPELYSSNKKNLEQQHESSCTLPKLNPWDSTILSYLSTGDPLKCKSLQEELTYLDDKNNLILNKSALMKAGFDRSSLDCRYRCFDWSTDMEIAEQDWINFEWEVKVLCEFVEVACSRQISSLLNVYSNLHSQVVRKRAHFPHEGTEVKQIASKRPNILLFVIDSQSRSNFARYLTNLTSVLSDSDYMSVRLDGYTKIGDNSFPNAAAVLTGKRVCVSGYEDELPCYLGNNYFDDWPLIWRNFSKSGYLTFYAEDHPEFNLFQYTYKGFKSKPVDHYLRPYWLKVWSSFLHKRSTYLCYGNEPKHMVQLDYLRRFFAAYQSQPDDVAPLFALNWLTELGHDWLGQIALGDKDFAQFFTDMKPLLNNSIVFVFSDHGHRFDSIRRTTVGRIEERLPYMSISIPERIRRQYPQIYANLRLNSKRLTSPFDVYATLADILNNNFDGSKLNSGQKLAYGKYGQSLFRPVPKNRQCHEAGIPEEYCMCQREISISDPESDILVRKAAIVLVDYLNNYLLVNVSKLCAKLSLKAITSAHIFSPSAESLFRHKSKKPLERDFISFIKRIFFNDDSPQGFLANYRIAIEVEPSNAVLEALFRYSLADNDFSVIGDVNRINKYGNQSLCVNSPILRKYCYCNFDT